jgi:asparagine synthase (glutamine-hydrolysing)
MVADVPVGCFLSSGIDSSLVAFNMQQTAARQVLTFSIGFREKGYDESALSTQTARALGVHHTVDILEPPTFEVLQGILQLYGQPFGDSSAIPTYFLSRAARSAVKVVLSGDGGDEAFGGYERYRLMLLANALTRVRGLTSLGRALLRRGGGAMSASRVLGRGMIVAGSTRAVAYRGLMQAFDHDSIKALLQHEPPAASGVHSAFEESGDVTRAAQISDLTTYLPGCLTTKVDIATMGHSLEARAPFLDHRLVELGLALPRTERVRLKVTKVLLRRIAANRLGKVVARRPKRGFDVPLEVWLRGAMREQAHDYLLGPASRLTAVVHRHLVTDDVDHFFAGDRSLHTRVWTLVALEAWLRSPLGRRAVP